MSAKRRKKDRGTKEKEPLTAEQRYWHRRYQLFSLFDLGIEMDEESWYSVTPEVLSKHHARRVGGADKIVVDACCGVGGNSIQLAKLCERVIAVDIDADKLRRGQANARIYGVEDKIDWVCGDFVILAANGFFNTLPISGVFVSPPWGGPKYINQSSLLLSDMPVDGALFWMAARSISTNIGMFLPRNLEIERYDLICVC
jgi:trimethylguanosine synthase